VIVCLPSSVPFPSRSVLAAEAVAVDRSAAVRWLGEKCNKVGHRLSAGAWFEGVKQARRSCGCSFLQCLESTRQ
jgi:flavin-dependent dehydrogenase